jgi:DNA polymerase III epsilon subunit-like protein
MRFIALDTETTGFRKDARILELGMVFYEDGVEVATWSSLFNPSGVDWGAAAVIQALQINHIDRNQLVGKPKFEECVPRLNAFFEKYDVVIAHNMSFDSRMLRQEYARAEKELHLPETQYCTMVLSRTLDQLASHTLDKVAEAHSITMESAHRAVVDARACGEIFLAMQKKYGKLQHYDNILR